jgi:hypothetical protein
MILMTLLTREVTTTIIIENVTNKTVE